MSDLVLPRDAHAVTAVDGCAARSRLKRVSDIVIATIALVLTLPVLLITAVAIMIDSGWPVVYAQERVGLDGGHFRVFKLRTMVRDAHALKSQVAHLNEAPFPAFKIRRDPRITRFGRLLRKSSIDELPQLWNVIVGDMSIVGPRPALPEEVAHYTDYARQRLAVRPGITGLWQLESRRGRLQRFDDWIECDLQYIATWSVRQDFVLMAGTIREVLALTGQ